MVRTPFYFVVNQGEPYESGTEIPISAEETLLGRPWKSHQPAIPFISLYISKRHLMVHRKASQVMVCDLGSKHGSRLNGLHLEPQSLYLLKNGDEVDLAGGTVNFTFKQLFDSEAENTSELQGTDNVALDKVIPLLILPERREILLEGKQLTLFGKDIDLLLLLYENRNQATSYDTIRYRIWPERVCSINDTPDVGTDEIAALVYRLRKKLGKYGSLIVTIPRYGYRLDL